MKIQVVIIIFVSILFGFTSIGETTLRTDFTGDNNWTTQEDCEQFVSEYEVWMGTYIELLKEYKADPTALAMSQKYQDMSMEMMNWASKWSELAVDCANYPEYESRFREIQDKFEKELEALGFK